MNNRWRNFWLVGLVFVVVGGLAIRLGYFKPGDLRWIVEPARSVVVPSTPSDMGYGHDVRYKSGAAIAFAGELQFKHQFNKNEYQEALACIEHGNFTEAERLLRDILHGTPDESLALSALATIQFTKRRYQEAESTYRTLQAQDPDSFLAPAGLGVVAEATGRYQEAIRELPIAIQDKPTFAPAYYWRARAYMNIELIAQGKADLEKVVELMPPQAQIAVEARDFLTRIKQGAPLDPDGYPGVN